MYSIFQFKNDSRCYIYYIWKLFKLICFQVYEFFEKKNFEKICKSIYNKNEKIENLCLI